jgi:predicted RNA-binding protein with PIN domain
VSKRIMLIDAYNVIHQISELQKLLDVSLEKARYALLQRCSLWLQHRRDITDFWVVFDGKTEFAHQNVHVQTSGIRAIFTNTTQTADEKIIEIIRYGSYTPAQYTVVSNDNFVINNSKSLGAKVISVQEFQQDARRKTASSSQDKGSVDEKSISQKDVKDINNWLSQELGL